jgi:hypothetical protein
MSYPYKSVVEKIDTLTRKYREWFYTPINIDMEAFPSISKDGLKEYNVIDEYFCYSFDPNRVYLQIEAWKGRGCR